MLSPFYRWRNQSLGRTGNSSEIKQLVNSWSKDQIQVCLALDPILACMLSRSIVSDSVILLWTVACQVPLSLGFPRQGYWSGLPFPPPRDLPNPGMKPVSCISCIGRRILYHCATWENFQVGVWNLKLIIWILLQISDSNINVLFNLCRNSLRFFTVAIYVGKWTCLKNPPLFLFFKMK